MTEAAKPGVMTAQEFWGAVDVLREAKVVVCGSEERPHIVHPSAIGKGKTRCIQCMTEVEV